MFSRTAQHERPAAGPAAVTGRKAQQSPPQRTKENNNVSLHVYHKSGRVTKKKKRAEELIRILKGYNVVINYCIKYCVSI